jgi:hypothetical protein
MKFNLTNYQRYYRLLAYIKSKKYSKIFHNAKDLHYHHVKPKSLFGEENNLIVCCPITVHIRLHYLLWKHYEDIKENEAANKMKYAYTQLITKFPFKKHTYIDERFLYGKFDMKTYHHLMTAYNINIVNNYDRL